MLCLLSSSRSSAPHTGNIIFYSKTRDTSSKIKRHNIDLAFARQQMYALPLHVMNSL